MTNRTVNKILVSLFLAVSILFSMTAPAAGTVAYAVTQGDIDALEKERDEIEAKRDAQQEVVDDLEAKNASLLERKEALDQRNAYTIEQMELNSKQIELYTEMIKDKAAEVDAAKAVEDAQLEKYRSRVRAMEENGSYDIIALILNASSLGELLTAMDDVGEIMNADKVLEDEYIAAREEHEAVKAEYEAYKKDLEQKQADLEAEQVRLKQQLDETDQMIVEISESIEEESAALEELEAAIDAAQVEIDNLVAQYQQEKAAAIGAYGYGGAAVTGSTNFIWPVSCHLITSCVGYRYHPVSGVYKYHSGMDIGCAYGDAIWASETGTVCIASWNGGYGNCVMIDHNNGYYTLYGHMSSIAVSQNQTVAQGQTIGYVGSTGVSTGPHLHFEIRSANADGSTTCLDFQSWFSGLSYTADSGGA